MKPCIIHPDGLSRTAQRWIHENFVLANGVRHYVPLTSVLVVAGNMLTIETMDIERPGHGRQRNQHRRWRRWRRTRSNRWEDLPTKVRRYRVRRPLTAVELAALYSMEDIDVTPLGEYGEQWLVTGTSDAHSAEEAVRAMWKQDLDPVDYEDQYGEYGPGDLGLTLRKDWAWKRPADRTADDELDEGDELVHGAKGEGWPRFAGYLAIL